MPAGWQMMQTSHLTRFHIAMKQRIGSENYAALLKLQNKKF